MSSSQNTFLCEYCNTPFSSKSNLNAHKKTAKYCIQQQGLSHDQFMCDYCQKTLATKYRLVEHMHTCKYKDHYDVKTRYEEKMNDIKMQYEEKYVQMRLNYENVCKEKDDLKHQVQDLQNKLYELASRPQVVNSNSNNNNMNNINNKVMNMQMITPQHLTEQAQHLTIDHIKRGAVGYGEYFLDHPLKDRVVCTDFSRRKLKYKNENGEIVTDPELTKLSESLFESIRDRNKELTKIYTKELTERFANKNNPAEISYFMELATKFSEQDIAVGKMLDGDKNEMFHDIIRHICSKTYGEM